jgi:hypothetical protein
MALFDVAPYITPPSFAAAGSKRWIQVAVNRAPDLLLQTLRPALLLDATDRIAWRSPLAVDAYREHRDVAALRRLDIHLPKRSLSSFWPEGGPVWDALGKTSAGQYIFVESKAHVAEIFTPGTRATPASRDLIIRSLREAQQHFAPRSRPAIWHRTGFQYANRLAFHFLFHTVNQLPSHMVFLYWTGATEMRNSPRWPWQYYSPIRRLHHILGLPPNFQAENVHEIFLDTSPLRDLV